MTDLVALGSASAATREPAAPALTSRALGVDIVRVPAALTIVWLHAVRTPEVYAHMGWARVATAMFCILAGLFMIQGLRKRPDQTLREFAISRFWKLYIPFVAWSVIYALSRVANYVLFGKVSSLGLEWELLWFGTTYHLWFLPFITVAMLLAYPLVRVVLGHPGLERLLAVGLFAAAVVATLAPVPEQLSPAIYPDAFSTILYARLPMFCVGLGMGLFTLGPRLPRVSTVVGVAAGAVSLLCIVHVASNAAGDAAVLFRRVAALGLAILAFVPWSGPVAEMLARLGRLGFGVYLCHVLFVEALHTARGAFGLGSGVAMDVGVFVVAATCSFAAAALLRRFSATRWLIPG